MPLTPDLKVRPAATKGFSSRSTDDSHRARFAVAAPSGTMASSSSGIRKAGSMSFSYWRKPPKRRRSMMTTNEYLNPPETVLPAELA